MANDLKTVLVKKADGSFERVPLSALSLGQKKDDSVPEDWTKENVFDLFIAGKLNLPPGVKKSEVKLPKNFSPTKKGASPLYLKRKNNFAAALPPAATASPRPAPVKSLPRPPAPKIAPPPPPLKKDDFKSPLDGDEELDTLDKRPAPPPARAVIPQVRPAAPMSTTTPVVSVFEHVPHSPSQPAKITPRLSVARDGAAPPVSARQSAPSADFKLRSEPGTKMPMRDIIKPKEMGPVDEIRYFTLVDLRRLASDSAEATRRLKQKFLNLRAESYLLYFDALAAWKASPLYIDYMRSVAAALKNRQTLNVSAGDKNQIQPKEIQLLIEMEKELK